MPEDAQSSSKLSWSLTITLLLLGHATTAAWNSFLNNEEYFKFKLAGGIEVAKTEKSNDTELSKEANLLNCAMIFGQFEKCNNCTDAECIADREKNLESLDNRCQNVQCKTFNCAINENLIESHVQQNLSDRDYNKRVAEIYDDYEVQMKKFFPTTTPETSSKSANNTEIDEKEGPDYVTFWGTTLSSVSLIITFLSANFAGMIIPHTGEALRINVMLIIASIVFVVHIFMAWFLTDITSFFVITLITVVVVILTSGIAQCSFFSVVGPMDSVFIVKLMEGQGLGGIVIAVFVIILDVIFKRDGKYGTDNMTMGTAIRANVSIFFVTTILALLGAIYFYHKVFKTSEQYRKCHQRTVSSTVSTNFSGNDEKNELLNTKSVSNEYITTGVIIGSIWKMMLSVFLNFFLCLSIFPACLTSIKWQDSDVDIFGIKKPDWSFIKYSVFLVFNIGDWLGKKFGGVSWSAEKENLTLSLEIIKMPVFWGLFWICDLTGTKTGVFANGYFFAAVMLLFATCNGYFGTLPMAHAAQILQNKLSDKYSSNEIKSAQGKVMPIMVASLVGGLMIGAFFSAYCVSLLETAKAQSRLEFQFTTIDELLK